MNAEISDEVPEEEPQAQPGETTDSGPTATQLAPAAPLPLSPQEERTWAMLAHLSILLNLISGFLGVVAALIIYLVYKDRSRYVAYQALQATLFQLVAWVGGGLITGLAWTFVGILSAVVIGICLIPLAVLISLIPLGAIVYGIIAGVACNEGQDFRYWLVGDWTESIVHG